MTIDESSAPGTDDRPGGRDIVLIAGLWLDGSVWDGVVDVLRGLGHRPVALTLPGAGDGSTDATLADQIAAVIAAVDAADRPVVVGHSAASSLAWIAADRRPEAVRGVVMIGGFPTSGGHAYADFFPIADGAMPFPGWEPFEGPDSVDLDEDARARLAERAIPVPEGVARGIVRLAEDRRRSVPVTLVCPEFGPEQAKAWIAAGEIPELAAAQHVSFVDIDSGHWPMITKADQTARLLDQIARKG
jgi:pimeloyl-ACP methyl ester carboxylesterase